jgi:hypothetical protein
MIITNIPYTECKYYIRFYYVNIIIIKTFIMSIPTLISINGDDYYDTKELYKYDKVYFYGCARSIRTIINKKNISKDDYIYASYNKKVGWTVYEDEDNLSNKAKLLLREYWVVNNIPKMCKDEEVKYEIDELPSKLILEDNEKFRDDEGNILEIDTYGERNHNKCYFNTINISEGFNMPSLSRVISSKDKNYIYNVHYKFFINTDTTNEDNHHQHKIYLTYKGILKVLFTSRVGIADKFIDWATETLFTVQMGSIKSKAKLVKQLGVSTDEMKRCLKIATRELSCVYLLSLGKVKDLRKVFNISDNIGDNYIICKFGRGENLDRRLSEHECDYGKIEGVNISIIKYAYIDPEYIVEAETSVSHMFDITENKLSVDRRRELIFIKPKNIKFVQEYFESLQKRFIGRYAMQVQENEKCQLIIKCKDKEIEDLKNNHNMKIELKNMEIDNIQKDLEIQKMKYLLLQNNINT